MKQFNTLEGLKFGFLTLATIIIGIVWLNLYGGILAFGLFMALALGVAFVGFIMAFKVKRFQDRLFKVALKHGTAAIIVLAIAFSFTMGGYAVSQINAHQNHNITIEVTNHSNQLY